MSPLSDISVPNRKNFSQLGSRRNKLPLHVIDILLHCEPDCIRQSSARETYLIILAVHAVTETSKIKSCSGACECLARADLSLHGHWAQNPRWFSGKTWLPKHCITHSAEPQPQSSFYNSFSWGIRWECVWERVWEKEDCNNDLPTHSASESS